MSEPEQRAAARGPIPDALGALTVWVLGVRDPEIQARVANIERELGELIELCPEVSSLQLDGSTLPDVGHDPSVPSRPHLVRGLSHELTAMPSTSIEDTPRPRLSDMMLKNTPVTAAERRLRGEGEIKYTAREQTMLEYLLEHPEGVRRSVLRGLFPEATEDAMSQVLSTFGQKLRADPNHQNRFWTQGSTRDRVWGISPRDAQDPSSPPTTPSSDRRPTSSALASASNISVSRAVVSQENRPVVSLLDHTGRKSEVALGLSPGATPEVERLGSRALTDWGLCVVKAEDGVAPYLVIKGDNGERRLDNLSALSVDVIRILVDFGDDGLTQHEIRETLQERTGRDNDPAKVREAIERAFVTLQRIGFHQQARFEKTRPSPRLQRNAWVISGGVGRPTT